MGKINLKNRKFKFWFYHVTHSEALIRSPKSENYDNNIDIHFIDITYIEMPSTLKDLRIEDGTQKDAIYLSNKLNKDVSLENIRVLISDGRRFYIVASIINITENMLPFMVLPFCTFMIDKEQFESDFESHKKEDL